MNPAKKEQSRFVKYCKRYPHVVLMHVHTIVSLAMVLFVARYFLLTTTPKTFPLDVFISMLFTAILFLVVILVVYKCVAFSKSKLGQWIETRSATAMHSLKLLIEFFMIFFVGKYVILTWGKEIIWNIVAILCIAFVLFNMLYEFKEHRRFFKNIK